MSNHFNVQADGQVRRRPLVPLPHIQSIVLTSVARPRGMQVKLKVGLSGPESATPVTVHEVLRKTAENFGRKPALCVQRGGAWVKWSYKEYYEDSVVRAPFSLPASPSFVFKICSLISSFSFSSWRPRRFLSSVLSRSTRWPSSVSTRPSGSLPTTALSLRVASRRASVCSSRVYKKYVNVSPLTQPALPRLAVPRGTRYCDPLRHDEQAWCALFFISPFVHSLQIQPRSIPNSRWPRIFCVSCDRRMCLCGAARARAVYCC